MSSADIQLYKLDDNGYEQEASDYADLFLSSMTCGGTSGESAGTITAADGTWNQLAELFAGLSYDAQAVLASATGDQTDGATGVAGAVGRYDYIISKYSTSNYSDFMNRIESGKLVLSNSINNIQTLSAGGVATIVIVAISAVSLVSLAALLLLKKKKEQ